MWMPSHGDLGLTIVQSHHAQRTCGSRMYLPSMCFRFDRQAVVPLWVSPPGEPLF
jgi:hypothetical protein